MALSKKQKAIYDEQDRILLALKKMKSFRFVLSGGTALSRFYFHHRYSEDLDFFCEEMDFTFEKVEKVAGFLRKEGFSTELITQSAKPGHLAAVIYSIGGKTDIKVDFLEDPFTGIWKPQKRKSDTGIEFRVDDPDQIYYRKFFSILEQWHKAGNIRRLKDLVDLYSLHRYHRSVEKTVIYYRENHVPIDEEKMIMILGSLKKSDLLERSEEDIFKLKEFNLAEVYETLKRAGDNLLREGLKHV